jgi:hypothetical protein
MLADLDVCHREVFGCNNYRNSWGVPQDSAKKAEYHEDVDNVTGRVADKVFFSY